jgi:hypothetical protein
MNSEILLISVALYCFTRPETQFTSLATPVTVPESKTDKTGGLMTTH